MNFQLWVNNKEIKTKTGYLTTREIVKEVLSSENQFYDKDKYKVIIDVTKDLPRSTQDQARKAILLDEKVNQVSIGKRNPLTARVLISATSKSHINQYNSKHLTQDSNYSDFSIEHGIWLAISGMPIGVCLDAFDHSNFLPYTVIVDIQSKWIRNELDAGRKGISSYRMRQIVDKVHELLKKNDFIKYRRYVVGGGDSRISDQLYDPANELRNRLKEKKEYNLPLKHKYFPPLEEQEVISLFFELVFTGILKGYKPKVLSSYQVYDGLFDYILKQDDSTEHSNNDKLGIHLEIHKSIFDFHDSV